MSSEEGITKEYIETMIKVQTQSAAHLERIAMTLTQILEQEGQNRAATEKVLGKLSNGISTDLERCKDNTLAAVTASRGAESYSRAAAWTVGGAAALITIAEIVLHVITKVHP
jgi:hypothetical protein